MINNAKNHEDHFGSVERNSWRPELLQLLHLLPAQPFWEMFRQTNAG